MQDMGQLTGNAFDQEMDNCFQKVSVSLGKVAGICLQNNWDTFIITAMTNTILCGVCLTYLVF